MRDLVHREAQSGKTSPAHGRSMEDWLNAGNVDSFQTVGADGQVGGGSSASSRPQSAGAIVGAGDHSRSGEATGGTFVTTQEQPLDGVSVEVVPHDPLRPGSSASGRAASSYSGDAMQAGSSCPALAEAVLNQGRARFLLCILHSQPPLSDHAAALRFAYEANLLVDQFWANEADLVVNREYWRALGNLKGQAMKAVAIEASFCNMPKATVMNLWTACDKFLSTNMDFMVFEKDPPSLADREIAYAEEKRRLRAEKLRKREELKQKMKNSFNVVRKISSVSLLLKKLTKEADSSAATSSKGSVMSTQKAEQMLPGRSDSKGRAGQLAADLSGAGAKVLRMNDGVRAFLEKAEDEELGVIETPKIEVKEGAPGVYERALARLEMRREAEKKRASEQSPKSRGSSSPKAGGRGAAHSFAGSGGAVPGSGKSVLAAKGLEPGRQEWSCRVCGECIVPGQLISNKSEFSIDDGTHSSRTQEYEKRINNHQTYVPWTNEQSPRAIPITITIYHYH